MACNPINFVIWFLILIFVSYIISGFSYFIWCFVAPFSGWGCLKELADLLMKGITFPQSCAERMLQ